MSKFKTILFIIGLVIIIGFVSKLFVKQPEYNNIDEYIEGEFLSENVEFINVENFYYIVGFNNGKPQKEEIVYINNDSIIETAVIKGIFNSTTYRRPFYPLVDFENLVTFSALKVNNKYWILVKTIVNSSDEAGLPKYNFYDNNGEWEYIQIIDNDDTHIYRNYFTVVSELDDYCAYVYFDGKEYQIITGGELEYVCDEDVKQKDIEDYYGLGN